MNKKRKILVVDDNQDICDILNEWITEECGCDVITANSGNQATEMLQSNHVDCLITDVKMPNGSGFDLLVNIKKMNLKLDKVIVMTGYSDIKEQEFRKNGAHHFFNKPIDLFEISKLLCDKKNES
jgi:DNA-binding NtrC family response regulator